MIYEVITMYRTIKIRMKLLEEQKTQLLMYEERCELQTLAIIKQFYSSHSEINFKNVKFENHIHKRNRWYLYQQALKRYRIILRNGKYTHTISSTWAPSSFAILHNNLYLNFGSSFIIKNIECKLVIEDKQEQELLENKIIHIDIVHDEKFWYANFVIKKDETRE